MEKLYILNQTFFVFLRRFLEMRALRRLRRRFRRRPRPKHHIFRYFRNAVGALFCIFSYPEDAGKPNELDKIMCIDRKNGRKREKRILNDWTCIIVISPALIQFNSIHSYAVQFNNWFINFCYLFGKI